MAPEGGAPRKAPAPRRVHTPTLLQLEALECGAAALGIVLAHHGRVVPLTDLRRDCGVSRDGSKASNVLKAARRYGMKAKGYTKSVEKLADVPLPCILFWNFNHFVVLEGFGKDRVFLNDPAVGHRTVTLGEFRRAFTGVCLVMERGEDFEPGGARPGVASRLRRRLAGSEPGVAFCVFAGFLLVIPGLAVPAFNQVFIDGVILAGRTDWLRPLVFAMLVAVISQVALRYLQLHYLRRIRIKLAMKLASDYIWHLLRLPAAFYAQRFPGEVANRSAINDKLADVLSGQLAQTAIDVVMMGFFAALMFWYDVWLTLIGIAFAAFNALLLRVISARRVEANMRVLQEYGKAQGTAMAGLQSIETIKASGLESDLFAKWAGHYAKASNARQSLELDNQALGIAPGLLQQLTVALVLVVGGARVMSGELTIGMLVAFQSLMASFLAPISQLLQLGGTFQELRGDLDRVDDVLVHPSLDPAPAHDASAESAWEDVRLKGYVELRDVTFGYSLLEPPLLENFSLRIEPGQRIALAGGSGSGKTTVAKIISGEYEPWSGEVLLDGVPRSRIPGGIMTNSFATVDQDIYLFRGTVRDNLTLWDATVPDENVLRACEDAAVRDVVMGLSGGLSGELLEDGVNLSGGQRQRLEIARALVRDPSILVLDEATSALDAETEAVVIDRLRMRGCTSIVVAHRLSTIRDADEIIVLSRGAVVERGTHDELSRADGEYALLMQADQEPVIASAEEAG